MARKIVITSGKGGVGKTSVTANLGIKLSELNKRVVMVDMDLGLNNLDIVMGVENKVVYDLIDAVEGRCRPKQALISVDGNKNLFVISSGHTYRNSGITGQYVKIVIDAFDKLFDYILIDCPAGIDSGFHRAVCSSDEAIVVTTPHISSLRDADKVISVLNSYELDKIRLVINMVRGDLVIGGEILSPESIEEVLKIQLIGVIPDDDKILLAKSGGVSRSAKSWKAYKLLAQNVDKGSNKIYGYKRGYKGFFGSIRRGLKKSL